MKQRDKKQKLAFLLLMVMTVMLFAGCKGEGGGQKGDSAEQMKGDVGNGRFFETEISLPKEIRGIMRFRKLADGSLALIGSNDGAKEYFLLKSTNQGETWEKTKITGIEKEYLPLAAIAEDGTAALFHYIKEGAVRVEQVDAAGKATSFSFSFPDAKGGNENNHIIQADYDREGNLIVLDLSGSFYIVDASGTCKKAFDTEGASIQYFSIAGNYLVAVHGEGVLFFETKEQKLLETESVLDDFMKKNQKLASLGTDTGQPVVFCEGTDENGIWFAMENGIFHFTRGGSVVEQLYDGAKATFSSGAAFLDMAVTGAESLFVAAKVGNGDKLLHYTYDEKAKAVPDKELTVYALDDSVYLRKVVTLFQKNNPDISVNLEFGLSGKDGVTLEDALSTLNTNVLAGKGPDVLILDGMPADSYIEKGILADISDVVEEVEQKDGIFPGIKEGSKKNGKIYAMPVRFLVSIVEGDEGASASAGTLDALAEHIQGLKGSKTTGNVLPKKGTRTLLRDLYYADSARWKKEDGTLDGEILTQYLTNAKKIYDVDSAKKEEDFRDRLGGDGTMDGEKDATNDSVGFLSKTQQISFGSLSDVYSLQMMYSVQRKTKTKYGLLNGENVKSYIPYLIAGVTEGGNKETAKAFVKELLGEKAENDESNGFPVNRAAYDELCKEKMDAQNVKDESGVSFGGGEGDQRFDFDFVNLTEKELQQFTDIACSLTRPALTNRVIQEIVLEQGDKYLLGEQELSQTVDVILQKVNLYLAE